VELLIQLKSFSSKDLLDQILKAINSILKDLGIKEVKFIPLTEDKSGDLGE